MRASKAMKPGRASIGSAPLTAAAAAWEMRFGSVESCQNRQTIQARYSDSSTWVVLFSQDRATIGNDADAHHASLRLPGAAPCQGGASFSGDACRVSTASGLP